MQAFVEWFRHQHSNGGITMPSRNVMEVQASLSREFCIGLHDMRYYIGVPTALARWFLGLPWACAAVSGTSLLLVCRGAQGSGVAVPSFCLRFDVNPPNYTRGLSHYHFLDVRLVEAARGRPDAYQISRRVYTTLPVRVAEHGDADVLSLVAEANQ